jgi:hypothetical protein
LSKSAAEKLLIKPGTTVWVSPPGRSDLIGPLPDDVALVPELATAGVALVFVDDAAATRAFLADHAADLGGPAVLWFLYPKGGRSDINRDTLWPMVAVHGLRPITQVAIDETWSALRFRPLAPDEAPFTGGR